MYMQAITPMDPGFYPYDTLKREWKERGLDPKLLQASHLRYQSEITIIFLVLPRRKVQKKLHFFNMINHGISKDLYCKIYCPQKTYSTSLLTLRSKLVFSFTLKHILLISQPPPYLESLQVLGPNFFVSAQSSANVLFVQQNFLGSSNIKIYSKTTTPYA